MGTSSTPFQSSRQPDSESSYFPGSFNSATETDSDAPGPGRLLGKAYGYLGRKLENRLSGVAMKLGRGPRATANRIRWLAQGSTPCDQIKQKKLEKTGKCLVRYIR